jgi:TetR/AcrR family transcriptional regulator, mexJK operon transcriptional repressor
MLAVLPSRRDARRAAILKAAREAFLDRGFLRTTLDDIVGRAGGSRATIYEAFGNKEGLFAAIVGDILEAMIADQDVDGPPDAVLRSIATGYMRQLMDPDCLALFRVLVGECAHMRELGRAVFRAGPERGARGLAEHLHRWTMTGELVVDDPDTAARQFIGMIEGDLHRRAIMWEHIATDAEIAANIDAAVKLFLDGARPR